MKKHRFFAVALALLMLLQAAPTVAFADGGTSNGNVYIVGNDELLDETLTNEDESGYFNNGTYTNCELDEDGEYYVNKQFDWVEGTDKSEGVITFKTKLGFDYPLERTVVYAFTPCTGHNFSKDVAKNNIEYLLGSYDRLDLITVTGVREDASESGRPFGQYVTTYEDIHIVENVGEDTDGDGKADYLNLLDGDYTGDGWGGFHGIPSDVWNRAGCHFNRSVYTGLYAYLAGMDDAMELESNPTQRITEFSREGVDELSGIYVSFDGVLSNGMLNRSGDHKHDFVVTMGVPYEWDGESFSNTAITYPDINYDCWELLYNYDKEGKYYSFGLDSTGRIPEISFWYTEMDEDESINDTDDAALYYRMWNEVLAMANPALLAKMKKTESDPITCAGIPKDALWNGETRTLYDASTGKGFLVRRYGIQNYYFRNNQDYVFDYAYNITFEEAGVPANELTLADQISDYFKLSPNAETKVEWEADPADGAEVEYTIDEEAGKVIFHIVRYKADTELTFRIYVAVNEDNGEICEWVDTNDSATLTINVGADEGEEPEVYEITSPKAHLETLLKDITVNKVWEDTGLSDYRPDSIKFSLYADDKKVDTAVVTADDDWSWTFADVPVYKNGEEIEYTVREDTLPGYTATVEETESDVWTVTNEIILKDISVVKTWDDGGQRNSRPDSITFRLYADSVEIDSADVTADDDWSWTFEDLPIYKNGEKIVYAVKEDAVDDYETTIKEVEPGVWKVTNKKKTNFDDPTNPPAPDPDDPRPDLNTKDHYAYIIGYPDGLVRPNGTITRAETVTIFFRMLTDASRDAVWSTDNSFTDVKAADWFNNAISTMENGGIINGYPDGSFNPNGKITRAEFAAMAIRFFQDAKVGPSRFSDTIGHWAEEAINKALEQGLITGYPDGTFRPDQPITRAEAMTIVNRVLKRAPHKDHLLPERDMIVWPDNMDKTVWYYADVQEATNSHEYTMNGEYENWERELPVRDWVAFEKMWSNSHSASNPGEVIGD